MVSILPSCPKPDDAPSIRRGLRNLQATRITLLRVADMIDGGINNIQNQCRGALIPTGICGLPEDILLKVFEASKLVIPIERHKMPIEVTLSQICHQFRVTIHRAPTLWSDLHSWFSGGMLYDYLRYRSGTATLTVHVCLSDFYSDVSSFFWAMRDDVHRWRELHLNSYGGHWNMDQIERLECLVKWLSQRNMESLNLLRVNFPSNYEGWLTEADYRKERFYEQWKMPALRRLELTSVVPGSRPCPSLVSFCFNVTDNGVKLNRYNIPSLWKFLQTCTALENLSLSLPPDFPMDRLQLGSVELPYLKSLVLSLRFCSTSSAEPFKFALSQIYAPNVTKLHLCTTFSFIDYSHDFNKWMEDVFHPVFGNYPAVTDFSLILIPGYSKEGGRFSLEGLAKLLKAFPALRTFQFGAESNADVDALPKMKVDGAIWCKCHPTIVTAPLAHISLHNCTIRDEHISYLLHELRSCPTWSEFEALEVVQGGCRSCLRRADIERLLLLETDEGPGVAWMEILYGRARFV